MKITQLVLSGCKRLMLNNIQQITFTPNAFYQLILGTNGSGKSSLLEELSPLPAISKHFIKGGYKKITIHHLGVDYVLTSTFKSASGQHSFMKMDNGVEEELNPGGTGQVQKTLVEQVFGITTNIHRLLIGKTKFTSLSPAKRREWITMVCSADYTYAIGVYQKLKSGARDAQGALKHTKQRLYNETTKLEQIKQLDTLEQRYQTLHQELSILFGEKRHDNPDLNELYQRYQTIRQDIVTLSDWLIRHSETLRLVNQQYRFGSLEDLQSALQEVKTQQEVNRALRVSLGKDYDELNGIIEELKHNNAGDAADIEKQIKELKQNIDTKKQTLKQFMEIKADPLIARDAIYEAFDQLIIGLKQLPANTNNRFNRQKITDAQQLRDQLKQLLEKERNKKASAEKHLEHLWSLKQQECPKCGYTWVPGKSEQEVEKHTQQIDESREHIEKLKERIDRLETFLEQAEDYQVKFNTLMRLMRDHPRLVDLWDHMFVDTRFTDEPFSLINDVNVFVNDVKIHSEIQQCTTKLERLYTLLDTTSQRSGGKQGLENRLQKTQERLEKVTEDLMKQQSLEQHLETHLKKTRKYLEAYERLENLIQETQELYLDLLEGERQKSLDGVIESHQNELSRLQVRRNEKTTLEGIIQDLQKDEDSLTQDQKALTLLANTLSPTDGLIAEQLMGFIDNFVQHVNQFIASVWTYELKVKGCGVESGDLDYRFPFTVNDGQGTLHVPDISEGSEAQLEIINLAFRLVTMIYLKLEEYPLYMDELGRSFDEQHRRNVMDFIKRLTDGANYTQLFMVSHFAAEYGAFTQAEVLVLSDTNIAVPQRHNEHVEII